MAELPNESKGTKGTEFSLEKRLLLAFILMGAVLFLTPYFYKPQPPPAQPQATEAAQPAETAAPEQTPKPEEPPPPAPEPEQAVAAKPVPRKIAGEKEQEFTIETDLYKVVFTNRGAVVKSWVLKKYVDSAGTPLELVNQEAAKKVGYAFSLDFIGQEPALNPNTALFAVKQHADPPGIEFELSDGQIYFRKSFEFQRDKYLTNVSSEVLRDGRSVPHLLVWRGGFGDMTAFKAASQQHSLFFDVTEDKLVVNDTDEAKDGPITQKGNYSFAGLEDAYFAVVALPEHSSSFAIRTYSDLLPAAENGEETYHAGAGFGGEGTNGFPLFVGPKDLDLLKQIDPKLQQLVDFGWFKLLAKPLFLALKWIHDHWVPNYGWSIILITIAINLLLFPLKITSLKSMKKMQALQPQVQALNEKYKGISMRDPRKAQQNEELMALYKKHGVNPAGGCMPMILQIPFFFAFYKVLRVAIELRGAEWLWVTDLSQPEHLPIRILPVAMVISQFAMQKMTPTTTPHGSQQRVMLMMPLFMGFLFYGVSSGLVLYWFTSNLVGVLQQFIINKTGDNPVVEVKEKPGQGSKKKRGRK